MQSVKMVMLFSLLCGVLCQTTVSCDVTQLLNTTVNALVENVVPAMVNQVFHGGFWWHCGEECQEDRHDAMEDRWDDWEDRWD